MFDAERSGAGSPSPLLSPLQGLLQLLKGRRGRTLLVGLCLAVVSIYLLSDQSVHGSGESHSFSHGLSSWTAPRPDSAAEASQNTTEAEAQPGSTPPLKTKNGPTFHLLMPATVADPNFCRTVLSSMLLEYPPATIVGYDRSQESTIVEVVHEHLQRDQAIKDEDLVLIVDGYRTWFQLPVSVLVQQYQAALYDANIRLARKYGIVPQSSTKAPYRPLFRQTVLWAADDHCFHETGGDVSCTAVPESPYWEDPDALNENYNVSEQTSYNPKFINSGTVIGPARDVRAIFAALVQQPATAYGRQDLQHALQTIYSEQEQAREVVRRYNLGMTGRMREWWYGLHASEAPLRETAKTSIRPDGRSYEFGMGLDYNSTLFQSMSPPHAFNGDISFVRSVDQPHPDYDSDYTTIDSKGRRIEHHVVDQRIPLPQPLRNAPAPYALAPKDAASASIPENIDTALSLTPKLDDLPGGDDYSWTEMPLGHNLRTRAIPAALHFPALATSSNSKQFERSTRRRGNVTTEEALDGDDGTDTGDNLQYLDPRDQLWSSLWFHPHARALLRRFLRQSTVKAYEDVAADAQEDAHAQWWRSDQRGGKGGVWTEQGEWLAWGDVCAGFEDEVFGDGKGEWGQEEGNPGRKKEKANQGQVAEVVTGVIDEAAKQAVPQSQPEPISGAGLDEEDREIEKANSGSSSKQAKPQSGGPADRPEAMPVDGSMPAITTTGHDEDPNGKKENPYSGIAAVVGEEGGSGGEKKEGFSPSSPLSSSSSSTSGGGVIDTGTTEFSGEVWDEIHGSETDHVEKMDDFLKGIDEIAERMSRRKRVR